MIVFQNTTDFPIVLLNGSLTSGKSEKSAPMPNLLAPLSHNEVGFCNPEGQWTFGAQGDSSYKTRLTLLYSAEHANLERLPPGCTWTADLQQNWKADVPQILVTFTTKEGSAIADTAPTKSSNKYVTAFYDLPISQSSHCLFAQHILSILPPHHMLHALSDHSIGAFSCSTLMLSLQSRIRRSRDWLWKTQVQAIAQGVRRA